MARSRRRTRTPARKTTTRRRSKPKLSISNTAQSLIIANAMSRGAFGVPLMTFLGITNDFNQYGSSSNNSNEVTARELFDLLIGRSNGGIFAGSFPDGLSGVLKSNIKANAWKMASAAILTPIAFKVGKQVLSKPIIRPMRKVIKMAGLKDVTI
jgi:hypothetical protein